MLKEPSQLFRNLILYCFDEKEIFCYEALVTEIKIPNVDDCLLGVIIVNNNVNNNVKLYKSVLSVLISSGLVNDESIYPNLCLLAREIIKCIPREQFDIFYSYQKGEISCQSKLLSLITNNHNKLLDAAFDNANFSSDEQSFTDFYWSNSLSKINNYYIKLLLRNDNDLPSYVFKLLVERFVAVNSENELNIILQIVLCIIECGYQIFLSEFMLCDYQKETKINVIGKYKLIKMTVEGCKLDLGDRLANRDWFSQLFISFVLTRQHGDYNNLKDNYKEIFTYLSLGGLQRANDVLLDYFC